jgi:hypothetical protein
MDPTAASFASNLNGSLHLHNNPPVPYHNNHNGNGYVTSPLHSPELNGNTKGRESPIIPVRKGSATPSSVSVNGAETDAENGEAPPKEERLIVGVDFGTTYSG